jgi:tetratricopeptide (TPR) repeat protein
MKTKQILLTFLFVTNLINAQVKAIEVKKSSDPLDISAEMEQITKYGTPTTTSVDELEQKAETLYTTLNWKDAITALEDYAENANRLANLLSQCIEPYNSASYSEKEKMAFSALKYYSAFIDKSNDYKQGRNRAYVKIGICYKNLGDLKKATAYLYKALDLLPLSDFEYSKISRNALAEIIQFTPPK